MTIHYEGFGVTVHHGDCLDVLRELPDESVDSVVTDPPYDLTLNKRGGTGMASLNPNSPAGRARIGTGNGGGFMGMGWDSTGIAFTPEVWIECLRVLKPGGHLLAFGGMRTQHRMICAIEDAGFEVRDALAWMYATGFPKSLNVSKAIDAVAATGKSNSVALSKSEAQRPVVGSVRRVVSKNRVAATGTTASGVKANMERFHDHELADIPVTAPVTDEAAQWEGWGTALKPAMEIITMARKPLVGTVAANVLAHGTGGLNIDASRIGTGGGTTRSEQAEYPRNPDGTEDRSQHWARTGHTIVALEAGRWPANVILDDEAAGMLDEQSGVTKSNGGSGDKSGKIAANVYGDYAQNVKGANAGGLGDSGGASRFYFTAKADAGERPSIDGINHPTVKPLDLMCWLVRLVTPPGGVVLEPFAGSGTTAEACLREGFGCIAIEREAEYLPLIVARITRQRDPVAHTKLVGTDEPTLFDLL